MDINFSKEDLAFRDELRDWLANDYPKHVKNKMLAISQPRVARDFWEA